LTNIAVTPDLSPGLVNDLKNRALALNPFLFSIAGIHII